MLKQLQMGLRAFMLFASRVWTCLCFMIKKQTRAIIQHQSVKYDLFPLSPLSRHRLSIVKRKVLVLDLDETLIHSHHDGVVRQTVRPGTPPDFVLKVVIDRHPVRFFVHKRPHVDFFLDIVSQWYELVVFTASMEIYGAAVADKLDAGRGILQRRFYRQHCTPDLGSYTKDLGAICNDLSSVFILDNSPGAYRAYPDNAIPIKSWFSDPTDVALLNLLPVLDALRFTADVRSVLSRNLHLHRLCGGYGTNNASSVVINSGSSSSSSMMMSSSMRSVSVLSGVGVGGLNKMHHRVATVNAATGKPLLIASNSSASDTNNADKSIERQGDLPLQNERVEDKKRLIDDIVTQVQEFEAPSTAKDRSGESSNSAAAATTSVFLCKSKQSGNSGGSSHTTTNTTSSSSNNDAGPSSSSDSSNNNSGGGGGGGSGCSSNNSMASKKFKSRIPQRMCN